MVGIVGRRRLLLALASSLAMLALLAAVEATLRGLGVGGFPAAPIHFAGLIEGESMIVPDPQLLWRLPPDSELLGYYRTNSSGYRGEEFTRKPDAGFRVVCIGDSCTFGLGVRVEETWPSRLGAALSYAFAGATACEVLDLGVPGYSSYQNLLQIEIELDDLDPDALVWMPTGYNDSGPAHGGTDRERSMSRSSLFGRFRDLRLVNAVLGTVPPGGSEGDGARRIGNQFAGPRGLEPRVSLPEFPENVRRGTTLAAERGIATVIVVPPLARKLLAMDPTLEQRISTLASSLAAGSEPFVDPRPAFDAYGGLPLDVDGLHPDGAGHRVLARMAFETLIRSGIAPAGPRREWIAAVLDALEHGFDAASRERLLGAGAPAGVVAWVRGGHHDPDLDPDLMRFDPLDDLAGGYDEGRLRLVALGIVEGELSRADAASRAEEIRRIAVPRDPFAAFLERTEVPAPEDVALARALTAWIRRCGLDPVRIDRRVGAAYVAGDVDAALALLDAAIAFAPGAVEPRVARITVLRASGRQREAAAAAAETLVDFPDAVPANIVVGLEALTRGDVARARARLAHGLERSPVSSDAHYGLGRIALFEGDFESALRHFSAVIALGPGGYPDVQALLAQAERRERLARVNR